MKKIVMTGIMLCTLFTTITYTWAKRNHKPLEGLTIVLDAGHGGKDQGANVNNVYEASINLSIVKEVSKLLKDAGAEVILTRNGNYDLASPNSKSRKNEDLKNRVAIMNDEKVDLCFSIHLNSYGSSQVHGGQVFYQQHNEDSKVLAKIIQDKMNKITSKSLQAKKGDYYVLNETNSLSVLIECGFISNKEEREKLQTKEYQKTIAESIYLSIYELFEFYD